jgi:transcriptional regulator with XRE-family HTH domain
MKERVGKPIVDLKAYCQKKGFTQVEIAEVFKVSPQWINDWFTGRKLPTAEKTLEIQEWLKTKPKPKGPRKAEILKGQGPEEAYLQRRASQRY